MYKLVAVDLDGTMLNHYGEISGKTKEIVTKCIEKRYRNCISFRKTHRFIKNNSERFRHQRLFYSWQWCSGL